MARPDHDKKCTRKIHKDGHWCWTPNENKELKEKKAENPTAQFKEIAKGINGGGGGGGVNRPSGFACLKKWHELEAEQVDEAWMADFGKMKISGNSKGGRL